jgi:hypothetical protein
MSVSYQGYGNHRWRWNDGNMKTYLFLPLTSLGIFIGTVKNIND